MIERYRKIIKGQVEAGADRAAAAGRVADPTGGDLDDLAPESHTAPKKGGRRRGAPVEESSEPTDSWGIE
jgi:hypothetical protein